jgi:D-glycero-beta-D-manno-heptose 1-phosphate adenylyltransferase
MNSEILTLTEFAANLKNLRKAGLRVVFTNGCFDILHVGHVRYLTAARSKGDILVVGLNSDLSVRQIKGEKRPIVPENQRAEVLAGLRCVDYVILFDEADPLKLIQSICPDVLVKGADWPEEAIIGASFVKAGGGRVERIAVVPETSTTLIIKKIIETFQN